MPWSHVPGLLTSNIELKILEQGQDLTHSIPVSHTLHLFAGDKLSSYNWRVCYSSHSTALKTLLCQQSKGHTEWFIQDIIKIKIGLCPQKSHHLLRYNNAWGNCTRHVPFAKGGLLNLNQKILSELVQKGRKQGVSPKVDKPQEWDLVWWKQHGWLKARPCPHEFQQSCSVSVPAAQGQQRLGSPLEMALELMVQGGQKCLEAMHTRRTCYCLWGGLQLSLFPSCKATKKMV